MGVSSSSWGYNPIYMDGFCENPNNMGDDWGYPYFRKLDGSVYEKCEHVRKFRADLVFFLFYTLLYFLLET